MNFSSPIKLPQQQPFDPQTLQLALFGFGCIGQGLWHVLNETRHIQGQITRICVRQPEKDRPLPKEFFTYDSQEILDSDVPIVVELIDRADDAWEIVRKALVQGKSVVSANKKMIAEHFAELIALQRQTGAALLYEAAACGSIPIIRNLEAYYTNDTLTDLTTICNGTCTYILSRIYHTGIDFSTALADAQRLGFAESDPTLDIDGWDALYKLLILTGHAFGLVLQPHQITRVGIRNVSAADLVFAREKHFKIQLLARSYRRADGQVATYVLPAFIDSLHPFYAVEDEYNAVSLTAAFAERQLLVGKGAGSYPTASAVLSDLSALIDGYRYDYNKIRRAEADKPTHTLDERIQVFVRSSDLDTWINRLRFDRIMTRHHNEDYSYVIGELKLSQIQEHQEGLCNEPVFLAIWPYEHLN